MKKNEPHSLPRTAPRTRRGFATPRPPLATHFMPGVQAGIGPEGQKMCKNVVRSLEVSDKSSIFAAINQIQNIMEHQEIKMETKELSVVIDRFEFALALKTWRLRQALTQQEVAEKWGCSRFTIIRAEGGKQLTWEMAYRLFNKLSNELRNEKP